MMGLWRSIRVYVECYGEGWGAGFILAPYLWDLFKFLRYGFYEPVWYWQGISLVSIGILMLLWSKWEKK